MRTSDTGSWLISTDASMGGSGRERSDVFRSSIDTALALLMGAAVLGVCGREMAKAAPICGKGSTRGSTGRRRSACTAARVEVRAVVDELDVTFLSTLSTELLNLSTSAGRGLALGMKVRARLLGSGVA